MTVTIEELKIMLANATLDELEAIERSVAADTRKGVHSAIAARRRVLELERDEDNRVDALYAFQESLAREHLAVQGTSLGEACCSCMKSSSQDRDAVIVGLDEVGRGSVAGPLCVGAVVLPATPHVRGINDSKKLTPEERKCVAEDIKAVALAHAVFYVAPQAIDARGMSACLRTAFQGALERIEASGIIPDVVLVDGNPLHLDPREINVIKGDARCASIGAASILAKVERDAYMERIAGYYPAYKFEENKGYASTEHIEAIRAHGLSPFHRASFCSGFLHTSEQAQDTLPFE